MLKTGDVRAGDSRLFISLNKPFGSIQTTTVRNIFIQAMDTAGIDIKKFGPHSARASSSSAPGLSLKEILAMGQWRQASTFFRYYEANIETN